LLGARQCGKYFATKWSDCSCDDFSQLRLGPRSDKAILQYTGSGLVMAVSKNKALCGLVCPPASLPRSGTIINSHGALLCVKHMLCEYGLLLCQLRQEHFFIQQYLICPTVVEMRWGTPARFTLEASTSRTRIASEALHREEPVCLPTPVKASQANHRLCPMVAAPSTTARMG
jgi:hypothetical protein